MTSTSPRALAPLPIRPLSLSTPHPSTPRRLPLRVWARAEAPGAAHDKNVFEATHCHLQRAHGSAPADAAAWGMRMRSALARYRDAEERLAKAWEVPTAQLEQTRLQARGALQVMHRMCDRSLHRVPESVVQALSQSDTWDSLQAAMAWRRRELHQPLRWSLPGPMPRTYCSAFDRLNRGLRRLSHSPQLAPALQAWALWVRQTVLPEYIILEKRCSARPDKELKTPAWRRDAMDTLDQALSKPWDAGGKLRAGFESLARAPRLCALLRTCRAALALRLQELASDWAHDIS